MKVCIAEKPSVAREIAKIIGANSKRDGYYEGNGYQVTWTFGHLCGLKAPQDYKAYWKRWDLNTLPMLPTKFETKLIDNDGVAKQFATIKRLFDKAEVVINCGDAGQEGELIQRWVINQAEYKGKVLRLWISSLTAEAIKDGFQQLRDAKEFDNLYYAGSSRAIGDWLLGINATRLYTLKYGAAKQVLSVGRVQTPTLAMLVKRHKEIENFESKTYWELQTIYREVAFNCQLGKFDEKEKGEEVIERIKDQEFEVLSFTKKKGKEHPPSLFDLTSLQVHCNKKFGYSADQTLKIVQKLYEQKLVTYPRVDTTYLPNDIYPKAPGILANLKQYHQFTQPLLGSALRKSGKVFNDKKVTDHHAIIPTGGEKNLPLQEQNVYDAIARYFIAAFYPDCIISNTTVIGQVDDVKFKATGKQILDQGWRVLFPKPKNKNLAATEDADDKKKDEEKILPEFQQGEKGPHQPRLAEKQTKPPKKYTEATLLRAMETAGKKVDNEELRELMKANGIGRPSTRANIIETLFRRRYIERKRKLILPTSMGVQLIDTIQNQLLKSAELTGQWEKQLRLIEQGEYSPVHFIHNMKKMVDDLVVEVRMAKEHPLIMMEEKTKNKKKTTASTKTVVHSTCPKCKKGKLLKGKTAYGCSQWKDGCKFLLPFEFMGKKISDNQLLRLLDKGSTVKLKGFKGESGKVNGKVVFAEDFSLQFENEAADTKKQTATSDEKPTCPKCDIGKVVKGKTAYGCSAWQNGCSFRAPFDEIRQKANGAKMTKELVLQILTTF